MDKHRMRVSLWALKRNAEAVLNIISNTDFYSERDLEESFELIEQELDDSIKWMGGAYEQGAVRAVEGV